MRRHPAAVIVGAVAGFLLAGFYEYEWRTLYIGDGAWPVTVLVKTPSGTTVKSVKYDSFTDKNPPDVVERWKQSGSEWYNDLQVAKPTGDNAYRAYVVTAEYFSPLRIARNRYYQSNLLMVRV